MIDKTLISFVWNEWQCAISQVELKDAHRNMRPSFHMNCKIWFSKSNHMIPFIWKDSGFYQTTHNQQI